MSEMANTRETQTARILIVDDDEDMPIVAGLALESRGYSVTIVRSGLKGIEAARQSVFDLLIVDLKMPGMSGAATIKEIRSFRPDVPVIVMTGSLDPRAEGIEQEIELCIYKPFRMNELRGEVEKVLGEHRRASSSAWKRHTDRGNRFEK